jgi:hypothetical protein
MVVRTNLRLSAALLFTIAGCAGNVVVGVPRDGGEDIVIEDPVSAAGDGGVTRDARVSGGADGATPSAPSKDAAAPTAPVADGSSPAAPVGNDAGPAVDPQPDPGSPTPTGAGRDLSTDKAKFTGGPRCSNAVIFCDDYEQTVGNAPGAAYSAAFGLMPKIDSTRALRGTRSLRFDVTAGTPNLVELKKGLPAMNNTLFGRMFVWVDALPTGPANTTWTLVGGSGSGNGAEVRLSGQFRDGKSYYGIASDGGETKDWFTAGKEPGSVAASGTWTCLEWMLKGDSSETRVWVDGVEQTSLHTTSIEYRDGDAEAGLRFKHPTFEKLRIGYWIYSADVAPKTTSVWIDELMYDDDRIGCVL